MKRYTKIGLAGLLAAVALLVTACGGSEAGGMGNMDKGRMEKEGRPAREDMKNMDHSDMEEGSGGMTSGMVMKNGKYSDERFIDAMVPHHEGAVDMAEVALENAEHEEIKRLAEDIVEAQKREISQMEQWRQQWYPQA